MISRLLHPRRAAWNETETAEDIDTYVDSRALAYPTKLEDDFVARAVSLGVESGVILDVGTRVGLVTLKMLWQNENFFAIGLDSSKLMIDRARATASAWEVEDRAFFQVGDARRMRFKTAYFDIGISDCTLHRFDDPVAVIAEIQRVVKPKGAIFIRDFQRPRRFSMSKQVATRSAQFGAPMRRQLEAAMRAAYTAEELQQIVQAAGLKDARVFALERDYIAIERRGQTDPNSWIKAREQYL
jgi:ubiquinone/menaquinone biosynthesis C-methylase UbiE